MATTTNFGWETPDDTDLVKDGALAIRTLGNSIDTSLVDLKGGTTGQVLSKTSNTDMDFTWVTSDDANAIQNAIVDAKGDLIAASAADTPARLAVGNSGETLVADSSASVGLSWSQAPSTGNPVLNSAFQVWQRGTSFSLAAGASVTYTADRWSLISGANQATTISRQTTSDNTNLPNIQYCSRVQRNSGQTGTGVMYYSQSFETINTIPLKGKQITLSFYARAGANYSPTSSILNAWVVTETGTDQNLNQYTSFGTKPIDGNATLTTTWQRFTFTGTVSSTANEMTVSFNMTPTGTASTNDYYEITGVQIDLGPVALPFRTYAATLAGELQAAQRYYFQTNTSQTYLGVGSANNTTETTFAFTVPVSMRATASISVSATGDFLLSPGSKTITSVTANGSGGNTPIGFYTGGSTALTAGNALQLINNSGTGVIKFSAEL